MKMEKLHKASLIGGGTSNIGAGSGDTPIPGGNINMIPMAMVK